MASFQLSIEFGQPKRRDESRLLDTEHATDSTSSSSNTDNQRLQQYGTLMSYLQYENTVYWERANFFLVASIAFFGFVVTNLPPFGATTPWDQALVFLAASFAGLCLSYLWWKGLQSGEFWIDRWHSLLQQIEPDAFGELKVMREFKQREGGPPRVRARKVSRLTLRLFCVLWSLSFAYSLVLIGFKIFA